jgi:Zn-dependent protease with chaperone function
VQKIDGRKVLRQHQLLQEQLGFVLGHELGHHYLGHLPCTGSGGVTAADVGRALASAVPIFNQPNEFAADVVGTNNVLAAGARRSDYHWNEEGALLTMQFFAGIDQMSPIDVVFGFERTHPPPLLRTPVIQQAASTWRATGGRGIPILGL